MKGAGPIILVSPHRRSVPSVFGEHEASVVFELYLQLVSSAGGVPIMAWAGTEGADDLVAMADGVLLLGGGDVDPAAYGAAGDDTVDGVDRGRDRLEMALARTAMDRGVPVLALCRGMQVLNVALGGTLHVDLERAGFTTRHRGPDSTLVRHPVRLSEDSRVGRILGTVETEAPSLHHQAVKDLGHGLRASGWSPDGAVEAVEGTGSGFVVGIQWHAEFAADPWRQRIFGALVDAAARRAGAQAGVADPGVGR